MRLFQRIEMPILLSFVTLSSPPATNGGEGASTERIAEMKTVAREMRQVLDDEFRRWYPRMLDTACGGFFSDADENWELNGNQDKFIVTQARHVWSAANAAMFYQKDNTLRTIAAHGVDFLRNKMWDKQYGGFYTLVDRCGKPIREEGHIIKRADGHAYAIYALARYFRASGDTAALKLAQTTFDWLENHSFDRQYGGYFQYLSQNGTPFTEGYNGSPPKDMNSSIHLLEGFAELYTVWPDAILRERLYELLQIVRDTIATTTGYMLLSFTREWSPLSFRDSTVSIRERNIALDHVSFGHDLEAAYLLLEASSALGVKDDSITMNVAKRMVDHALDNGWDEERGGFYDWGYYEQAEKKPRIVRKTKEWWPQAEALNALLMMADLFPSDEHKYDGNFSRQWEYCKKYIIDRERGGWYWGGTDAKPENIHSPKSSIWKGNYHTSRALINCISRLNHVAALREARRYEPVNPNTTREARRLLEYVYSIRGKKIISGYMNFIHTTEKDARRVQEITGKLPALWGCDFIDYFHSAGNADSVIREAYKKYREGYIITLMFHQGRPKDDPPFDWKESYQGKLTDDEWQELITPGTPLNIRWQHQVDTVAGFLKKLQSLGVPILWRPYHESNGVWFWWGNRRGKNGSAKLYTMMFDRFVHHHQLNNLIWVWNANAPRQLLNDEAYAYEDFFPGLEYVDVLAADIYHHDYRQSHHDQLIELGQGKPIAMGEIGEAPTAEILSEQPMWTWFMMWAGAVDANNTPERIVELYNNSRVITHETQGK